MLFRSVAEGDHSEDDGGDGEDGKRPRLLGSGAILPEVVKAAELQADRFGVMAEVWSVTSYKELHNEAVAAARWNRLHPGEAGRISHLAGCLGSSAGPVVAATDYVKAVPCAVAPWVPAAFAPVCVSSGALTRRFWRAGICFCRRGGLGGEVAAAFFFRQ